MYAPITSNRKPQEHDAPKQRGPTPGYSRAAPRKGKKELSVGHCCFPGQLVLGFLEHPSTLNCDFLLLSHSPGSSPFVFTLGFMQTTLWCLLFTSSPVVYLSFPPSLLSDCSPQLVCLWVLKAVLSLLG